MRTPFLKYILLVCLVACLGFDSFAQADTDSPYSLFGLGQVRDKSMNTRLQGMGGVANAMFGGVMINAENPASLAKIDSMAFLFDAGFYFKTSSFSTSTLTEPASNASFDYLSMAFGLTPWWKISLGIQPYSTAGYTMLVENTVPEVGNTTTRFQGKGGLNQVFMGHGFKLGKHFAIGANINYVFGNTETETSLFFPDSAYFIGTRRSVDVMVHSFMFDYGLLFNTNLSNGLALSLGLTYTQPIRLNGDETLFVRSIEEDIDTEVEYVIDTIYSATRKTKINMPQGIGFGVALQGDRWTFGADFNWMQWSKFRREGATDVLQDSWSVSAGFEITPKHTSISGYFSKVSYRVGAFYEHGMICLEGNDGLDHSINKEAITVGMALPLPRTLSRINLAIEIGQYGTREGGLIQERYGKLSVGVSVFEQWFMKRRYR